MTRVHLIRIVLLLLTALTVTTSAEQPNTEEFARRQYESGMAFIQNRRYNEALKDLQAVVDSFASSSVADNALLQIAQYHLEVSRNNAASQAAIEKLLKTYPDSDSAPGAYVVTGRLALAKGRATADIDAALASFERVLRLYPGTDAVPAAIFYGGEALRIARRTDEALDRFRRITMEYPRSLWAARANLAAGYCLVQTGRAQRGLQGLQWVRQQFPGTPAATEALNLNTTIYRLYVRAPAQPAYALSGRSIATERSEFQEVIGVRAESDGRVLLGHKAGVAIFDAKGAPAGVIPAQEPSAFFVDEANRIVTVKGAYFTPERAETVLVVAPDDGQMRPVEKIAAVVPTSSGERLVADAKAKIVVRVSAQGKYIAAFATVNAARLAINGLDDVAILDKSTKSVTIADRSGKQLGRIPTKGTDYELDDPVDIAYDSLGHLYVLDRGRGSVFVFGPRNRIVATLTIPDKSPGALSKAVAFAVDAAGRLFVYDERSKRIQVYQ